jgi:hypothetical protein
LRISWRMCAPSQESGTKRGLARLKHGLSI